MVRTCRKLPKEWEKYEPLGKVIGDTRIIVFKTPLRPELLSRLPKAKHFTTQHLLRKIAEQGKQLGMVINLTNTRRYYDRKELEGMCIEYKEILCPGRGFIEREDLVKTFCKAVERFYEEYYDKDILLGVHCSNGVNRSGYLICRYLIDSLGWNSHEAIAAFESARGYSIERGAFVQAIYRADKERRLKKKRRSEDVSEEEDIVSEKEKRRKKKKRKTDASEEGTPEADGFDPTLTAQMMHQFFAMEQHFRAAAESKQYGSPYGTSTQSPYTQVAPNAIQVMQPQVSHTTPVHMAMKKPRMEKSPMISNGHPGALDVSAESSPFVGSQNTGEYDEEEEEEEADWSLTMGEEFESIDDAQKSKTKKRRERRARREKMFNVMKRGKFYEIQEMLQEQQARLSNK
uniref:Tyrosine specific protein phosphatases domain-containing protein n=1 Tax=Acrobeloides nanus TaxID=290746 RepID=A0A914EGL0_9BILA